MKNNFSKILKTGKLCEVYFDPDNTGKFAVYRLLYVGNDCYVAAAYDKYGIMTALSADISTKR